MNDDERYEALTDALEYCRDPRRELSVGRKLGPVLLGYDSPGVNEPWTAEQQYALAAQLSELIRRELVANRQLIGLTTPAISSPALHAQALPVDRDQRHGELLFWSLLWAYYVCQIPINEIGQLCGWNLDQSRVFIEHGRRQSMTKKLAVLEQEQSAAREKQTRGRPSIDARNQRIMHNSGIAINGDVSGSRVEQHVLRRPTDRE